MPSKEVSSPFNIASNITVSGSGSFISSVSSILYRDSLGYQANLVSGLPVGILQVNTSFDYNPGNPQSAGGLASGNWTTISSLSVSATTAWPITFNLNQLAMPYAQIQFSGSSGGGVISIFTSAKSLG